MCIRQTISMLWKDLIQLETRFSWQIHQWTGMTLIHFPNPDTTMNVTFLVNMEVHVNNPQITLCPYR